MICAQPLLMLSTAISAPLFSTPTSVPEVLGPERTDSSESTVTRYTPLVNVSAGVSGVVGSVGVVGLVGVVGSSGVTGVLGVEGALGVEIVGSVCLSTAAL